MRFDSYLKGSSLHTDDTYYMTNELRQRCILYLIQLTITPVKNDLWLMSIISMIWERSDLYRHILAVCKTSGIGTCSKVQWEAEQSLSILAEERVELREVIKRGRVCSRRNKNAS